MSYETYTTVDWLMFFYIYCFLGWCFESTYVSIQHKKWINRGFMRGPFLPLYGSGAVIMLFVTIPVRDNFFLTFLFGAVGATISNTSPEPRWRPSSRSVTGITATIAST